MTVFWLLLLGAAGMVVAQDVVPGAGVYHTGWYNAICIALFAIAAASKRRNGLALAGCAIVVFAGAASGLMAPDTHTVVGAPGATVHDADLGASLVFPIDGTRVSLQRGNSNLAIDGGRRYTGGFVLWQEPRTVVDVDAADAKGNHLTVTQPTNASFLSPVLLMQQSMTIAGMNVRFDTFSIPAVQRNVKAVLFSEQQAAQLRADPPIIGEPAVLFDVSDTADRELPGGIGIVASGSRRSLAGIVLGATVRSYPAVVVASAPYWPVLALGLLLFAAGAVRAARAQRA